MDIIEIALDSFTDFVKFEQLAAEIVTGEGYSNLRVVGGVDDEGVDAQQVKYFDDDTKTTIFQFSIQKNISSKINDTVKKLIANKITFQELVIVTKNQINNSQALKTKFREKYKNKYKLEIIERGTFLLKMAADKLLFARYFPNINQQLELNLLSSKTIFSDNSKDTLANSLLKCSLLFTFNRSANPTRKNLIDKLVLAIIVDEKKSTLTSIASKISEQYSKEMPIQQVTSSIDRLTKENLLKSESGFLLPSKSAIERIEGNQIKVGVATKALIDEIIQTVSSNYSKSIDKAVLKKININVKNSLSAFFRLHGIDYNSLLETKTTDYSPFGFEEKTDLITLAKKDLDKELGELVVYAIGAVIKKPTPEQAEVLADWCKAFISIQIMSLDPTLKEFQATTISKKSLVIDTDVLLYCIVSECKLSETYAKLVNELKALKCKLYIPNEIISEVIKHGDAEKNYNYFKNSFQVVDESFIEEQLHNVFVKGYYTGITSGKLLNTTSFKSYLSNYIDLDNPYDFIVELINYKYPDTFIIGDLSSIGSQVINIELVENLTKKIFELTKNTFKAGWRTDEENIEIAENDAKIYLTTYSLNKKSNVGSNSIMPGSHYLLTTSTRAAKCGRKIGLNTTVVIRPETLISTLQQIGSFKVNNTEYINLFENPYLIEIAKDSWSEIKTLVDAGLYLKGKNPIRLKYDLEEVIHTYLSGNENDYAEPSLAAGEEPGLNDYMKFVFEVKSKGYNFSPSIETLIQKYREIEKDRKEKQDIIVQLMKETENFGKKKQKYFEKITKGKK